METFKHQQVHETIRCQRNWDWDTPIEPQHLELIQEYIEKPPQQQGELCFNTVCILNNYSAVDSLQKITTHSGSSQKQDRNPQSHILAPLVIVWTTNMSIYHSVGPVKPHLHAGLHSGIVAQASNSLGYQTGFMGCAPNSGGRFISWIQSCGLDPQMHEEFLFALAIGRGKPGQPYNRDHNDDYNHHRVPYNWPQSDWL